MTAILDMISSFVAILIGAALAHFGVHGEETTPPSDPVPVVAPATEPTAADAPESRDAPKA